MKKTIILKQVEITFNADDVPDFMVASFNAYVANKFREINAVLAEHYGPGVNMRIGGATMTARVSSKSAGAAVAGEGA